MPTIPTATDADDNVRYTWVAAIAGAAVTAAEANAGVELSCWIDGGGGWQPGLNETMVTDKRACSSQDYESPGRYKRSLKVRYVTAPQGTNTAKTTLVPGTLGYMLERRGLPVDTAYAAGQKYNQWPVTPGKYSDLPPEENAKFKTEQNLAVRGPVLIDAVVLA
jgi:hypothetical protein